MANVKEVSIDGQLPFNFIEEAESSETPEGEELIKFMVRFMQPSFGLRLEWREEKFIINNRGGKTAVYQFHVGGMEALSREWFKAFVRSVRAVPFGEIWGGLIADLEERKTGPYRIQEFVMSEILRLEFGGYWNPQEEIDTLRKLRARTWRSTPPKVRKAIAEAAAAGVEEIKRGMEEVERATKKLP